MFSDTISILVAPSDTIILNRVNQDNYGSEYAYSDALRAANLKIRHSTDSVDKDGLVMRRHNVFFEYVVYPTLTVALKKYSSTSTFRGDKYCDPALEASIAKGVNTWLASGTVIADLVAGNN